MMSISACSRFFSFVFQTLIVKKCNAMQILLCNYSNKEQIQALQNETDDEAQGGLIAKVYELRRFEENQGVECFSQKHHFVKLYYVCTIPRACM